jgi:hypothetical protein
MDAPLVDASSYQFFKKWLDAEEEKKGVGRLRNLWGNANRALKIEIGMVHCYIVALWYMTKFITFHHRKVKYHVHFPTPET